MFQLIYVHFADDLSFLRVLRYLTFRSGGAAATALIIGFWLGPYLISRLRLSQSQGQPIREDGPLAHLTSKRGTPTMGGLLILGCLVFSTLLWADLSNPFVWVVLLVTLSYGIIGFWDDATKLLRASSKAVPGWLRLLLQSVIALLAMTVLVRVQSPELSHALAVPFFKDVAIPLGPFIYVMGVLVIVGTANSVNLTDGLDGLAIVPAVIAIGCYGLIAWVVGNIVFSQYLIVPYVAGTGELAVFCGAAIGAGLAFLWFNAPPAQVFMGDTGSLALGGALGAMAVATKHEIVLLIIGGLFVVETVSVIVQVVSFRLTGTRIFRMAPLHHHFELKGWQEPTIVIRFWIISFMLALAGLSTLKLR